MAGRETKSLEMISAEVLTLGIETSNPGGPQGAAGVALVRGDLAAGGELLGVEPLVGGARHDDAMLPAIDKLTKAAGVKPAEIGRIAVSVGPGGYTATRVAVVCAKTIAEATGAEVVGVPTAFGVAKRVRAAGAFTALLAWKRGSGWCHWFDENKRTAGEPGVMSFDEIVSCAHGQGEALGTLVLDDEALGILRDQHELSGDVRTEPIVFDAVAVIEASVGLAAVDVASLVPVYPREPEAVRLWEGRR